MRDHVRGGALTETTFFVLLALYRPNHGYGIMQFIEQETHGRLSLGAGTLYGAINALLKKGWIAPYDEEQDSRKKLYLITGEGRKVAEKELKRLNSLCETARRIIEGSGEGE
ncbi:MAG TPA: helix-turn-helix transcriptional regulator [Thermoclostridium caenicola]|uniref:Transcriptional regulator PadR-like family protein n=1 Tax=Thermoclostridium caenicola TaxID=659425 RepID=A0A1M6IV98_9FIRM|nr:helix-turn-helix transcriptional regulator [Thermoclostridium caenicola]SHJ38411.1 Transcriptional regulator PadR-like family protein [Thermoclostridium caenicola]HOK42186.1 helix-turn-helix transcriptional regulator [Thermoclostridium caenicola]HOL85148.1 helix-turn-helix transcriptional regulator [Thermoclostridium caenicola]HPO76766.1 helix-turn-helix transcriptional regulator [Thermoclostridium caenicola]